MIESQEKELQDVMNKEEKNLKVLLRKKIHKLRIKMTENEDPTVAENLSKMIKMSMGTLEGLEGEKISNNKATKKVNTKTVNAKIKTIANIPLFQLEKDKVEFKTKNKIDYENVEDFLSTFEAILKINKVDLDKEWKDYITESFLLSQNDKHSRFYKTQLLNTKEGTTWKVAKKIIMERYSDPTNVNKDLEQIVEMEQSKIESVRDFIDRYIEARSKIPNSMKWPTNTLDVVTFMGKILPITREGIKRCLEKDHSGKDNGTTCYPNNLEDLFTYIRRNVNEIQDHTILILQNEKRKREMRNEGEPKRFKPNHANSNNNDKRHYQQNNKEICKFCKKVEHSFEHMIKCADYLASDTYQDYLKKKRNQREQVQVLYIDEITNKSNKFDISNNRAMHNEIQEDIENIFPELENQLDILNHKNLNKNNDKNDKNNIECLIIDSSLENVHKESPYSLAITVNNEKLVGTLDTGAEISLINKAYKFEDPSIFEKINPTKGQLIFAVKGSTAQRIGQTKKLEISYKGKPTFDHAFEIIEMHNKNKTPLLIGRDLIPKLGIQVMNLAYTFDEQEEIIYDDEIDESKYIPNVTKACSEKEYLQFMEKMEPYLKENSNINVHNLCPLKEATVYLKTPPNTYAHTRQYPVAYALQPVVQDQIKKWLSDKTIEPATPSGFNSPLTLVPKPNSSDGSKKWRVCLDTRKINSLLEDVSNVNTPLIEDIFHSMRESKIFSVFDITGAFHRLEINKADRHKLTFTFEGKSWQFRGACFGLKSLSGIFQNVMETIFAEMKEFTCIYIDDLVCHSKDLASHETHCKKIIETFTKFNLPINQEKTHLARNSVNLLGFCISEAGRSIDTRRLTNIDQWEKPKTPKAMMRYCGLISYLRSHLPNASALTAPLDHLRYSTSKTLTWTDEMHSHYDSITNIIKKNIVLSHPDLNHPFSLAVDASHYAVGACLFQEFIDKDKGTKTIKYIGFTSKALSKSQRSYSVTKKELFALTTGLTKFYKFLHGDRKFVAYTDHRSISYIFSSKHLSMMMLRYMEVILSFPNMQVVWIPGKENVMSDKLSRLFPQETDTVILEKDEKKLFPQIFNNNNHHKNMKLKKKLVQKKENQLNKPTKEEFIQKHKNINHERVSNFETYFVSTDVNEEKSASCNQVIMKSWEMKTIHKLLDEDLTEPQDTEGFEINYIQKMDESLIVPPESDRHDILRIAHEFGHFGAEAIVQKIRKDEGMDWPKIREDALEIARKCPNCQRFSITKKGYNPLKPLYCYTCHELNCLIRIYKH